MSEGVVVSGVASVHVLRKEDDSGAHAEPILPIQPTKVTVVEVRLSEEVAKV